MKESIIIKNLGPLRDIEIPDIRPLTLFIGESGSGKSLLMKVLILFRYIYKMLNIRWYLKNSNVNRSRFKLSLGNLLSPELKQYFKNNSRLEIIYRVEVNGHTYSVEYRNGGIDRHTTDRKIEGEDLVFLKESWISEMRNVIPEWASFGHMPKNKSLNFYFQETLSDFLDASDKVRRLDLGYLGLAFDVEKKGDNRKFIVRPLDNSYSPLEWKYTSSGVQTSSSLPMVVAYFASEFSFKDAINRSLINYLYDTETLTQYKPTLEPSAMKRIVHIHVEEPELNLFPDAQCSLINDLVKMAFDSKSADRELRLMFATHSPYIINYLNIIINQTSPAKARLGVDNLAVYRLFNGRLQSLIAEDEQGRKFVETFDLTAPMADIMEEYEQLTNSANG